MKMIKTEFNHKVNESSSWIVYITKSREDADNLHTFAMTQREMLKETSSDWYYTVSTVEILNDCRVPEFFHRNGYYATIVEHNNGDWSKESNYKLYIVE